MGIRSKVNNLYHRLTCIDSHQLQMSVELFSFKVECETQSLQDNSCLALTRREQDVSGPLLYYTRLTVSSDAINSQVVYAEISC